MQKLEAILFDLDGTLLDSAPDLRQAVNLMLQDEGRPPLTLEQVKSFVGSGAMELCRLALEATGGVPTDDLFPFVQKYITYLRSVRPDPQQVFPHVRDTLAQLYKDGIKLAICTNKNEKPTVDLLEQLDLIRYFAFIAGSDTFTVHKPHPGHILGILDALKVQAKNVVFVGDGPNDVVACERAGIPCLVVTHGYSRAYENMGAAALIGGFDELILALSSLRTEP